MTTASIINEINSLPLMKRMLIIEKALQSIRAAKNKESLTRAANKLRNDYNEDKELTIFTNLDFADFYEAR